MTRYTRLTELASNSSVCFYVQQMWANKRLSHGALVIFSIELFGLETFSTIAVDNMRETEFISFIWDACIRFCIESGTWDGNVIEN
jgi:hypothetical protein